MIDAKDVGVISQASSVYYNALVLCGGAPPDNYTNICLQRPSWPLISNMLAIYATDWMGEGDNVNENIDRLRSKNVTLHTQKYVFN